MFLRLKLWLGAAMAAVGVVLAAWMAGKREGRSRARSEALEDDYENADAIRDRVERDLGQRVRDYDGRGYRD